MSYPTVVNTLIELTPAITKVTCIYLPFLPATVAGFLFNGYVVSTAMKKLEKRGYEVDNSVGDNWGCYWMFVIGPFIGLFSGCAASYIGHRLSPRISSTLIGWLRNTSSYRTSIADKAKIE